MPGDYFVRAGGKSQMVPTLQGYPQEEEVPTYHPSSTRETAVAVNVGPGSEATGIDIRYRGLRGHTVSGTVAGGLTADDFAAIVTLAGVSSGSMEEAVVVAQQSPSKGFAFYGLADGDYTLMAESEGNTKAQGAASTPMKITVRGADVSGISITLTPLASIAGTVVLEPIPDRDPVKNCSKLLELSDSAVQAKPAAPRPPSFTDVLDIGRQDGVPDSAGRFTMKRLLPGPYRVFTSPLDDGWFIRSMTMPKPVPGKPNAIADVAKDGVSLASGQNAEGMIITLAPGAAAVDGRLVDSQGRAPSKDFDVYLVPAEADSADALLRYSRVEPRVGAAFSIRNIAPGEYRLVLKPRVRDPKTGASQRALYFDDKSRKALRTEALASGQELKLEECKRAADVVITVK
jgi:hypothetical protein